MTTASVRDGSQADARSTCVRGLLFAVAFLLLGSGVSAALLPPEKLVPEDTVALVTTRDFHTLADALGKIPELGIWGDEALKPFKDKFLLHWQEDLAQPLERELQVNFAMLQDFRRGQCTFALTPNGADGRLDSGLNWLLMLEAKDHC